MHRHVARSLLTIVLPVGLLAGCTSPPPPAPRTLTNFTASITPGVFSHDVVLTNRNNRLFRQVDLTVTIYFENKTETLSRHYGYWNHDESQIINVAASGRIQRVAIDGTAVSGAELEPVQLSGNWLLDHGRAK